MSSWVVVPCLLALREEYNRANPERDKGADGTIGDTSHSSGSDHTPDEDSTVLDGKDADSVNEVHALDIDSSGPWPEPGWFNDSVMIIVANHRAGRDNRLQNVIWNHKIASRSWGWTWHDYTGSSDPHTGHVHFSARYTTAQENDTSPWGVYEEDEMALTATDIDAVENAAYVGSVRAISGGGKAAVDGSQPGVTANDRLVREGFWALQARDMNSLKVLIAEVKAIAMGIDEEVITALFSPATPDEEVANVLRELLGTRKDAVKALL